MNLKNYIQELKRRNVIKSAIAYLVVAWLLVQVLSIVLPTFNAAPSILKTTIIALIIGFPIWIIFSWVFELTSEGLKKTDAVEIDTSVTSKTNVRLNRVIIGALSVVVILLIVNQFRMSESNASEIAELTKVDNRKSIAVLPFSNMSIEDENVFFTEGVQEDVLNKLAGLKELKVISRTSVLKFKNYEGSLAEIGKRLDVKYIVEGSVQRNENRVKVTAKLIDAASEEMLWSNNYDRILENVFELQNEIAQEIVEKLKTKISEQEVKSLNEIPTKNIDAYDNFVKARLIINAAYYNYNQLVEAIGYLKKAVEFDANFVEAWAALSQSYSDQYQWQNNYGDDKSILPGIKEVALNALHKTIELNSESHHRYRAEGYFKDYVTEDPIGALKSFDKALAIFPNDAQTLKYQAEIYFKLAQVDNSVDNLEKAYAIDSENRSIIYGLTMGYEFAHRYKDMVPFLERLLELEPDKTHYAVQSKYYQFLNDGKLETFKAFENAVKTVKKTDVRDDRSVQNNEMTVAMLNNDFESYSIAYKGKWDRHQRGHGEWACPMIDNDDVNHAHLLMQKGKMEQAEEIIEKAKSAITHPYQKNGFCIFNKAAYNPKLEYMSGDKSLARKQFDSIVPEILNNTNFPRGPVERMVLLQTADMVAPDQVYVIYKQIISKPVTFTTMESVCANPWTYPNLLKDPNFIKDVKEDGRFVKFLEHYKLIPKEQS